MEVSETKILRFSSRLEKFLMGKMDQYYKDKDLQFHPRSRYLFKNWHLKQAF